MDAPILICAWCGLVLVEGVEPPSHGICEHCAKDWAVSQQDTEHAIAEREKIRALYRQEAAC